MSRSHALLLLALPALAAAADVVGPESCKACHPAAYDAWRDTPHARALQSLPEKSRKDPRCLACHAPDLDAGVEGVTCESCHGPGSVYEASYVMRDPELARATGLQDPGEKTCLACHTGSTPSLETFRYADKLQLIRHWDDGAGGAAPPARPAGGPNPPAPPARPAAPARHP